MLYTYALFCVLFCGRFSYILMTVMCMQLVHVLHVHSLRITLQWSSLWLRHTALTGYDKYGADANSAGPNASDHITSTSSKARKVFCFESGGNQCYCPSSSHLSREICCLDYRTGLLLTCRACSLTTWPFCGS